MKVINELKYDFGLTRPKATVTQNTAVVENIKGIAAISDSSVTVFAKKCFVTVKGSSLSVSEIWEGRMEIEGEIRGVEFYGTQSKDKNQGIPPGEALDRGRKG